MKRIIIAASLLAFSTNSWAAATTLWTCWVTRSTAIGIAIAGEGAERKMIVQDIHWQNGVISEAVLNDSTIVEYGNTFIGLANLGRSGYALVHVSGAEGDYKGRLDINLFPESLHKYNTRGVFDTHCDKRP